MARKNKKKQITEMRRQQILDAALTVFSQKGYDQATTAEIAQTAGIAEGTIYNYFKSKRDVLLSIIMRFLEIKPVISQLEKSTESTDNALFTAIIKNRIDTAFNNIDNLMLLIPEIQRDPELRPIYYKQVIQPAYSAIKKYYESGKASGTFRDLNSDVAMRIVMAIIIGLTVIYRIEGEEGYLRKIPHQEVATEIANLILKGINKK